MTVETSTKLIQFHQITFPLAGIPPVYERFQRGERLICPLPTSRFWRSIRGCVFIGMQRAGPYDDPHKPVSAKKVFSMRIAQPFDRGSNTIIVIVTAVGCVEDSDASILICGASDRSHYRKCGGESCGRCNREIMFRKVSIERHGCLLSGHLDV